MLALRLGAQSAMLLLLSASLWTARLINESEVFHRHWAEELWLLALRPAALFGLGVVLVYLHIRVLEKTRFREYVLWSFLAAAIFCLPYVPDMHASFIRAGSSHATVLSFLFYLLGIVTYGIVRGGTCYLGVAVLSRYMRITAKRVQVFLLYFFILLVEFCFFHTWHPITYFPALPLPVPAAQFVTDKPSTQVKYILFETAIDGKRRSELARGGTLGLSILGQRLADSIKNRLTGAELSESVVVILPETFVSLEDLSEAGSLIAPVSDVLFESKKVKSMVWIQGAFVSNSNVVLGTEIYRREGSLNEDTPLPMRILRQKREHMPMFEAPSKGISYSSEKPKDSLQEEQVSNDMPNLKTFVETHKIMICYESLFPSHWRRGHPALVLTNHHLFNEYRLMNWVYIGFIRQLSYLFNSPTKIVSNYNPSGMMLPVMGEASAEASAEQGWKVIPLAE